MQTIHFCYVKVLNNEDVIIHEISTHVPHMVRKMLKLYGCRNVLISPC